MHFTDSDNQRMALALKLARRGEGLVEPNPMVGCVIVKNDTIIGQGYHRRFGGPHAEIEALRSCKQKPTSATLHCTLEPCSHVGKTPPCVDALIQAGIARVIIPRLDPNPQVNGRGVRLLRCAGVKVEVGLLADEADQLLRPFLTRVLRNRPYVIAKWAQSLDGQLVVPSRVACPSPVESGAGMSKLKHGGATLDHATPQWISCEESRRRVHMLRARIDAVMVGAGTVLHDDPILTARDVPLKRAAMRWVLDGRLRTPTTAHLVRTARRYATVILTTQEKSQSRKAATLRRAGVEVLPFKARAGVINIEGILTSSLFSGVTNLLVEGGPTLLNQFFRDNLVDEAHIYVAPKILAASSADSKPICLGDREPQSITTYLSGRDTLYKLLYANP